MLSNLRFDDSGYVPTRRLQQHQQHQGAGDDDDHGSRRHDGQHVGVNGHAHGHDGDGDATAAGKAVGGRRVITGASLAQLGDDDDSGSELEAASTSSHSEYDTDRVGDGVSDMQFSLPPLDD